ncbi:hypothetical protein FSP39_024572 [Pinctada imbricata]|uniref:Uncharacterized protein n=1 Tax=Pinctada imbricata TaxID=66713 RepID=A0AA88YPG4_PINIB|nr:hypothetical protein FSP39_024572 [Pinctada imbricata]
MNTDFRYLTERATSREVEQILRAVMHKLFLQVGVSVSSALERETLFQHFHRMRCDKSTMTEIQEAFASESTLTNRTVNNFLQILLMELIGQILSECYQQEVKQATDVKESMSQNDRQILYYIAGYIVRSLRKNTNRIHQTDEGVLAALDKMQSDGTTELSTYASWFNQVNRGGLKRPSDTLVDLVCAMEIVVRGKVSFDNLSSTSLLVAPLKEAILESTAVKHYADQIFRGCKFDNSFQVERIAYLFLKIRGFAVVRAKRTQLHASKTNNSKPSFSLRQVQDDQRVSTLCDTFQILQELSSSAVKLAMHSPSI